MMIREIKRRKTDDGFDLLFITQVQAGFQLFESTRVDALADGRKCKDLLAIGGGMQFSRKRLIAFDLLMSDMGKAVL